MRFAVVSALFAGAVMAQSTTYVTDVVTITSCAATVTNCPARSTVTSTTSYPVQMTGTITDYNTETITSCAASITNCPAKGYHNATTPVAATSTPAAILSSAPVVAPESTVTITVSACPTTLASLTSAAVTAPITTGTGSPAPGKNTTSPTTPSSPKFTGAASTISGSLAFAGVAAIAAFFL